MLGLLTTVHDNKYGHLYREVDRQKIKYVVYLRKSSEENSDKQLKSIGDQFQDIKERVLDVGTNKITNYDVVEEEHSRQNVGYSYQVQGHDCCTLRRKVSGLNSLASRQARPEI